MWSATELLPPAWQQTTQAGMCVSVTQTPLLPSLCPCALPCPYDKFAPLIACMLHYLPAILHYLVCAQVSALGEACCDNLRQRDSANHCLSFLRGTIPWVCLLPNSHSCLYALAAAAWASPAAQASHHGHQRPASSLPVTSVAADNVTSITADNTWWADDARMQHANYSKACRRHI